MKTPKISLFDAYRKAAMTNPHANDKEAFGYFLEIVQSDSSYVVALAQEYFYRQRRDWQPVEVKPNSFTIAATPTRQEAENKKQTQRAETTKRTEHEVERIKIRLRDVVLSSIYMPNGKMSGDCTGAELEKVGGFWAAIAKAVGSRNVMRKKLTEDEAHNIRERYFKDEARRSAPRGEARASP